MKSEINNAAELKIQRSGWLYIVNPINVIPMKKPFNLIIIAFCFSLTNCVNSVKTSKDAPQIVEGYYLPKDYLNYDFSSDAINAIGFNISKTDSSLQYAFFNCQECMPMGDNWTRSEKLSESEFLSHWKNIETKRGSGLLCISDMQIFKVGDTLFHISKDKFKALNKCQFEYIEEELRKGNAKSNHILFNKSGKLEGIGNCFPAGCSSNASINLKYESNSCEIEYSNGEAIYSASGQIFLGKENNEIIKITNRKNKETNKPLDDCYLFINQDKSGVALVLYFDKTLEVAEDCESNPDNCNTDGIEFSVNK
jgi:hypothetical protein